MVVYTLSFLSLFASLFVLRAFCRRVVSGAMGPTLAPAIFALFLPWIMTQGGHFYDLSEIFFFAASAWACVAGRAALLPVLTLLGTYNKESFLIFLPTLYPLLRTTQPVWTARLNIGVNMLLSAAVYFYLRQRFAGNPGGAVEVRLMENLHYYLNPMSYVKFELTYGIISPKGLSAIAIILVASVAIATWRYASHSLRAHIGWAFALNVPLLLAFCRGGELRNLSLVFVGLVALICIAVNEGVKHSTPAVDPIISERS